MNSKVTMGLRILFALFCIMMGVNKFLGFMPMPPIPGDGGTLMGIYVSSGFLRFIGVLETLGGLALLTNKFVPLALTFLTAIMFNACIFHFLHDMAGMAPAAMGLGMSLALVVLHRVRFSEYLRA